MPDATVVDKFPKSTVTKAQVKEIQQNRLTQLNAKSCDLKEDDPADWILTTVWPGGC
jgi:hypothetical protein